MARCVPGAKLAAQAEDGSLPGVMAVSFGPRKINFRGRATCEFDDNVLSGFVHGRGTADMRSPRIGVNATYALSDARDAAAPEALVKTVFDT